MKIAILTLPAAAGANAQIFSRTLHGALQVPSDALVPAVIFGMDVAGSVPPVDAGSAAVLSLVLLGPGAIPRGMEFAVRYDF